MYMKQLNIHMTAEFEKHLKLYMKKKGIKEKSSAVRQALKDALERLEQNKPTQDFRGWLGMGLKSPVNSRPRFKNEDDLWS